MANFIISYLQTAIQRSASKIMQVKYSHCFNFTFDKSSKLSLITGENWEIVTFVTCDISRKGYSSLSRR